jgi:TusA-related sulfurtransferase
MSELIDARGLGCAEPVILAKNALDLCDEVTLIVDARAALENIKALGKYSGCVVDVTEEPGNVYYIRLKKTGPDSIDNHTPI